MSKATRDCLRAKQRSLDEAMSNRDAAELFKSVTADTVFLLDLSQTSDVTETRRLEEQQLKRRLVLLRNQLS